MEDTQRAFNALPKSKYWRRSSRRSHGEGTPARVMEALWYPTLPPEPQENGNTAYFHYRALDDAWFRVVLDADGALYTAFWDDDTSGRRRRVRSRR